MSISMLWVRHPRCRNSNRPTSGEYNLSNTTSRRARTRNRAEQAVIANASNAAARLISETAHDLRSPLTAVRESVRLVHDGDLGAINAHQRSVLSDAINQCECVDHLVGEMVTLDRLRTGLPRVCRGFYPVSSVRQSVDRTLRPWALPRQIAVVWDGADDPNLKVFADLHALRRLIVNLVVNAIRVTGDGDCVLIEVRRVRGGEAVKWTVVDQGAGISESDMVQIASRQQSLSGGEGLGLMISRQLAAMHFSQLSIRSRLGTGTEVSVETPAGCPRNVAACWVNWRRRFANTNALEKDGQLRVIEQGSSRIRPPRRTRLQPPSVMIEIAAEGNAPRCENVVTVGTVTLGAALPLHTADQFDTLFQNQLQRFDLAYRVDARRWVWILDADQQCVADRIETMMQAVSKEIASLRVTWSDPKTLSLQQPRTVALISDLMIRKSFSAFDATRIQDSNEVRLGTLPIEPSEIATLRLKQQVRWLSDR
jgi:anti-sigma regulatory factor (Ser/Thr protein kinase)